MRYIIFLLSGVVAMNSCSDGLRRDGSPSIQRSMRILSEETASVVIRQLTSPSDGPKDSPHPQERLRDIAYYLTVRMRVEELQLRKRIAQPDPAARLDEEEFYTGVTAMLLKHGFRVLNDSSRGGGQLSLRLFPQVTLERLSGLFETRRIRTISAKGLLNISNGNALLHSAVFDIAYRDTLTAEEAEQLGEEKYDVPIVSNESSWVGDIFIPVTVSAAMGLVVYLFFSVRSR